MISNLKRIIGIRNVNRIKYVLFFITHFSLIFQKKRIVKNTKLIKNIKNYSQRNKNVFCGYYDLEPIKNNKLLVHVCNKDSKTNKDKLEIGYYELDSDKYIKIIDTSAWCWQQGSRLRWSSQENDVFYFNDICNEEYCCIKYNLKTSKVEKVINSPIYDMDINEKYGISINFSRLQRLRPGYGYNSLIANDSQTKASKDDGLFVVDINTGEKKLLISLYDLAIKIDPELKYEHYLNHISFSPNGQKIMFFHLWTEKKQFDWNNELCVINIDGSNLSILEKSDLISHYDWRSDNEILITSVDKETKIEKYVLYNIDNMSKYIVDNIDLKKDGHPVFKNMDVFYSDTYPNKENMQTLFKYDLNNNKFEKILDIYSDLRLIGEERCDLHPKYMQKENIILIDSTFNGKKRSVVMIELEDDFNEK